jgi:hypothetical protein
MTMSKKSTTKKSTSKKAPRMSASAARADGAAKTKRALAEAKAATDANLKAIAAADQENAAKRDERAAASDGMAKSERAIAAAKKSKATKSRAKQPTREPKAKRISGLDLAAKVLASAKEPLNAKTIAERAIAAGWKTSGATPHATLYAAMIREIAAKGKDARFRKTDRGLFASSGKGA